MSIRCNLRNYYSTGVTIDSSQDILWSISKQDRQILDKIGEKKKTALRMLLENLSVLGFVSGKSLTPRGLSFIIPRLVENENLILIGIAEGIFRLVLLKSIVDIDWRCFSKMMYSYHILGKRREDIRRKHYPYDSEGNFPHRFGFHNKVARETAISNILRKNKSDFKSIVAMKILDPYDKDFVCNKFFKTETHVPSHNDLKDVLSVSLKQYTKIFKEHSPFGYAEVLKTMVQTLLLNDSLFLQEPLLCDRLIEELVSRKVGLYRSSKPIRIMGRGLYRWTEKQYLSYVYFRTPIEVPRSR